MRRKYSAGGCRVDLRERGGASKAIVKEPSCRGRSPRARRSHPRRGAQALLRGSISASAEEPRPSPGAPTAPRVDLRERGGARCRRCGHPTTGGRSPRARRSLVDDGPRTGAIGSISASAEEPSRALNSRSTPRVDLRERGGATMCPANLRNGEGRSPRARRSRATDRALGELKGSISASAEEPIHRRRCWRQRRVDLRERGGAASMAERERDAAGRSPRARRSPLGSSAAVPARGSISASAEEPTWGTWVYHWWGVDLRERGGASSAE